MVSIFTDLKKAQLYKMPYRNSPHQEIEMVTKIDYQHLFKPFDLVKKTHARIVNDENFLFKIEDKKYFFLLEKMYIILKQLMILMNVFQKPVIMMLNILLLSLKKIYITWQIRSILLVKNLKIRKCLTKVNICIKKTLN